MPEPTAYIVMAGHLPIAASSDLDKAKAYAETNAAKYDTEPRKFRWDSFAHTWQLMWLNERTGRWNKAIEFISAARDLRDLDTTTA